MNDKIRISVVMPTLNEEKSLPVVVADIRKYAKDYETEIVIVDSSSDSTAQVARSLGVRVISQPKRGHGVALRKAIAEAKNDIIITADCDNTYPMEFIPHLVGLVTRDGYDIISCNRLTPALKKEMPLANKVANWGFAALVRLLYGLRVHDVTTGMFCMKKKVNDNIAWETNYSFPCEIIVRSNRARFRHMEIDIPYRIRIGEVTLNRWRSGKAYLRCIFNYRFKLGISPEKL